MQSSCKYRLTSSPSVEGVLLYCHPTLKVFGFIIFYTYETQINYITDNTCNAAIYISIDFYVVI
jgi:hypothetical protein